jgi:hypothetical protein
MRCLETVAGILLFQKKAYNSVELIFFILQAKVTQIDLTQIKIAINLSLLEHKAKTESDHSSAC